MAMGGNSCDRGMEKQTGTPIFVSELSSDYIPPLFPSITPIYNIPYSTMVAPIFLSIVSVLFRVEVPVFGVGIWAEGLGILGVGVWIL